MVAQPDRREEANAERGGVERIRDAAIELFGQHGVNGTSLKAIAERAGVSPALIIHHYGSKDGLRVACDQYVADTLLALKTDAVRQGPRLDPVMLTSQIAEFRPLMRYLAKTLVDGSPHVNDLIDKMVEHAEQYTEEGVAAGLVKPSANPRARVVVLFLFAMGSLVLHEHFKRLLGVDLIDGDEPPVAYLQAVLEIYCEGVLTPGTYQNVRSYLDQLEEQSDPKGGSDDERD
ncbi:TetR family transcriptional regulator [Thermocrispum sp.]|uniref:TetR family transcriptional regulator n=1 Tax=Thermocrispum agreste TaxID=37925 RepID=A0ABD6FGM1_9PSEU|nr:TetR family transcriptional regulator [Thermocrispum sp.]